MVILCQGRGGTTRTWLLPLEEKNKTALCQVRNTRKYLKGGEKKLLYINVDLAYLWSLSLWNKGREASNEKLR